MKITSLAWFAALALLFALPSHAAPQVEASMLVTGSVSIAPNGNVTSYSLDQPEKLPDGAKKVIAKTVPTWLFAPVVVDGKRVAGVSHMTLRLLAKPLSKGQYAISVHGARFDNPSKHEGVSYSGKRRVKPHYPAIARRSHAGGTAFVVARVDRQGKVAKIAVQQVNLGGYGTQIQMKRLRKAFANASTNAIKNWTFKLPSEGRKVGADHWDVTIPVKFSIANPMRPKPKSAAYGEWQTYLPGPHNKVAWLDADQAPASSTDVLPSGSLASASQSRQLLTPLGASLGQADN